LTLHPSPSILGSLTGDYTRDTPSSKATSSDGSGAEFVFAKPGGVLDLYSSDAATGALKLVCSTNLFCVVTSVANFRVQGSKRDCLVVGSDSGCVTVLRYATDSEGAVQLQQVACNPYGKTGVRRNSPGQYVAADPAGRAIMLAAVDKTKLVYVVSRDGVSKDGDATMVLASPLEASKQGTITFDVQAVDCGFENPVFAALELSYADADLDTTGEAAKEASKMLTYYELDLGLNHVTRKWTTQVPRTACKLAQIPGGANGPSGVLVLSEDDVSYYHDTATPVSCPLPRRANHPEGKGVIVTAVTVHRQKKNKFFAIVQTELGDVFKVTLGGDATKVTSIRCQLIDTLPLGTAINVTKMGLLFLAAEFGDHHLYQLEQSIISLDGAVETSSESPSAVPSFVPSTTLSNMLTIDTVPSTCGATELLVGEYASNETAPQIYAFCGRGARSNMRVMRHGAAITELANSPLPGTPAAIFTVKAKDSDEDEYIVLAFEDATLVLSIGESVEEVADSGFDLSVKTLACARLASGGMVQVHPTGLRHITASGQKKEWQCPGLKKVSIASCNSHQVMIAYEGGGGEVTYFELDQSWNVNETSSVTVGCEVSALDVGIVPKGRSRSLFGVVGGMDESVKVLSLDPGDLLSARSSCVVSGTPSSLCLIDMDNTLYLNIGTTNGLMQQTTLDAVSGSLAGNPTKRFLGVKPVKSGRVSIDGKACAVMLSTRPWVSYISASSNNLTTSPLSFASLDNVCGFSSSMISEGIVATSGNTLRILTIENIESNFNETKVPLRYTPRQSCLISGKLAVVEADANDVTEAAKKAAGYGGAEGASGAGGDDGMDVDDDEDDQEEKLAKTTTVRGPIPTAPGSWGSCVRLVDPSSTATLDVLECGEGEAALCCCAIQFQSQGGEVLLAVGKSVGLQFNPLSFRDNYICLYRVVEDRLTLLHATKVDGIVGGMTQCQGRLLAGVGGKLCMYDMGKKQLLRKCEVRVTDRMIKTVAAAGDRIFVGCVGDSVQIFKFDLGSMRIFPVCEDVMPRNIVATTVLDINTVCASDRFGNVFVLRCPKNAVEESVVADKGGLFGNKSVGVNFEVVAHYYVGEVVVGMKRASLIQGGSEAVVYITITGKIGALLPIKAKDDIELFKGLQDKLRSKATKLCGRDFGQYRSSYAPISHVVDGDLVRLWGTLSLEAQKEIAEELDQTVAGINKKIENMSSELL
jgi:splicing factor 3B subunit 3